MPTDEFFNNVMALLAANGWEQLFQLVPVVDGASSKLELRLSPDHPTAPNSIVNVYSPTDHSLEQIQYECLRALRTGRPGA